MDRSRESTYEYDSLGRIITVTTGSGEVTRFYSEDRHMGNVLDPLSLNRYNYCKSSPLNYTDPSD